ncbi:HNH endonuclease [Bosea sp. NPDC055594]
MIPIQNIDQLSENLLNFESGIRSSDQSKVQSYKDFVKRGICFVPYIVESSIHFAPSRFIGYINNDLQQHESESKHGQITNDAISRVLRHDPALIPNLEKTFRDYCQSLGFDAQERGQFGRERRYWLPEEVLSQIEAEIVKNISSDPSVNATDRQQVILARIGQGQFRKNLIDLWKKCPITNVEIVSILRASHIKPWANSTNIERVDPYNGILLSPNMDALFDKGFISFKDDGSIIISHQIGADGMRALGGDARIKLRFDPKHFPYLAFHRSERLQS